MCSRPYLGRMGGRGGEGGISLNPCEFCWGEKTVGGKKTVRIYLEKGESISTLLFGGFWEGWGTGEGKHTSEAADFES